VSLLRVLPEVGGSNRFLRARNHSPLTLFLNLLIHYSHVHLIRLFSQFISQIPMAYLHLYSTDLFHKSHHIYVFILVNHFRFSLRSLFIIKIIKIPKDQIIQNHRDYVPTHPQYHSKTILRSL